MTTKIHIVEIGQPGESVLKVVHDNELLLNSQTFCDERYLLSEFCIKIRHYDDDGDSYYDEPTPVTIKETFLVKVSAEFIRNDKDNSKLNACTMSGGFSQINRLAFSYSVVVMTYTGHGKVWESDLIYSNAGIRSTQFDMYSYHFNEPEQRYDESRLDYEVFESLNLTKILGNYLPKADVRDSVIDDILN